MQVDRPNWCDGFADFSLRDLSDAPEQWLGNVGSYAPFLGVQGNTLYDLSGENYHGIMTNFNLSTAWTISERGVSLQFDGVGAFVDFRPARASMNLNVGSLLVWLKTPNAGGGFRGIAVKSNAYGLFFFGSELITYDWSTGGRGTGVNLDDNLWHMVALTFNSGVIGGTFVYIDGVPVLQTEITIVNHASAFVLGCGSESGAIQHFAGFLDDVRLYGRVLSSAEVMAIYVDPFTRYRLRGRVWAMSFDVTDVSQFRRRPPR